MFSTALTFPPLHLGHMARVVFLLIILGPGSFFFGFFSLVSRLFSANHSHFLYMDAGVLPKILAISLAGNFLYFVMMKSSSSGVQSLVVLAPIKSPLSLSPG